MEQAGSVAENGSVFYLQGMDVISFLYIYIYIYEVPFHGFLIWQIFCVSLSIPGFHVSMHMAPDTIVSMEN
jgi:hypothetical protein